MSSDIDGIRKKVENCARILNFSICVHTNLGVTTSQYLLTDPAANLDVLSNLTVAVMWSTVDVCYHYNPAMNMLSFPLSVLQIWLLYIEMNASEFVKKSPTLPIKPLLKLPEDIFPYCLFNHILCQFRLRELRPSLSPIILHEHCSGMLFLC